MGAGGSSSLWRDEIIAECPRKRARNESDPCGARCPDLSKVL